jgi:hypothetical protein
MIVVEILLGLAAGPCGLRWFSLDAPVNARPGPAGATFLFFLAALEVDLRQIRGRMLARSLSRRTSRARGRRCSQRRCWMRPDWSKGLLVGVAFYATGFGPGRTHPS